MHELSIAMSIVDTAIRELDKYPEMEIDTIELEIGKLSGVEMTAFEFAWPLAIKDTPLERAERITHHIEGEAVCQDCGASFEKTQLFDPCPNCGSYFHEIRKGKELLIKSISVIERAAVKP